MTSDILLPNLRTESFKKGELLALDLRRLLHGLREIQEECERPNPSLNQNELLRGLHDALETDDSLGKTGQVIANEISSSTKKPNITGLNLIKIIERFIESLFQEPLAY